MVALSRLTLTEFKLLLRDPAVLFAVFAIPLGSLVMFGSMVSGGEPSTDPRASVEFFSAMAVSMSLGMLALFTIPTYLGTYREKGILRRLAVTPVRPEMLLTAQVVVNMVLALVVAALVIVVGTLALGVDAPQNASGFLLAFVLGGSSLFTIGLLIAALASTGRAAGSIGPLLFFPLLFFAGIWMPKEQMPDVLARISDFTPLSATLNSLQASWQGEAPETLHLAVLVAFTLVVGALAAKTFRWG